MSGGGYIGSWLSAWVHRAGGIEAVEPKLAAARPGDAADPVHHLREYNSYLTPKTGIASLDTWTLAAIVLRNLLLNWCLMIPLLMLFLMVPRIFTAVLQISPPGQLAPPLITDVVKWAAAVLFCVATVNVFRSLPSIGGANLSYRAFKLNCFGPLVGAVFCFVTWSWWNWEGVDRLEELIGRPEVLTGWVLGMTAVSWLLYAILIRRDVRALFGPVALGVLIFGRFHRRGRLCLHGMAANVSAAG